MINNKKIWDIMESDNFLKINYKDINKEKILFKLYENIDPFLNNSFIINGTIFLWLFLVKL